MGRHDGTRIGLGGTLLGLGAAAMIALLIFSADEQFSGDRSAWCLLWFPIVFGIAAVAAATGLYVLGAVMFGWPFPATYIERQFQPRLEGTTVRVISSRRGEVVFSVGTYNAGRSNIDAALVNVVVPDFIREIHRCTERGETGRPEHAGAFSSVPEKLQPDDDETASIYWNGNISFPGRIHRIAYFKVVMDTRRDFPIRLQITAPELEEPLQQRFDLNLSGVSEQEQGGQAA